MAFLLCALHELRREWARLMFVSKLYRTQTQNTLARSPADPASTAWQALPIASESLLLIGLHGRQTPRLQF